MFFAKIFLLCTVSCVLAVTHQPVVLSDDDLTQAALMLDKIIDYGDVYSSGKVVEATKQTDNGITFNFIVNLVDKNGHQKECRVTIWKRVVPLGFNFKVNCPNEPEVIDHLDA
ncbi:hypothetical protein KR018_002545 [Drosophila ironensis]|nr:hypothetical protein KR018_002545 [Drosophila ironensis]